ncbi:T9SS type A sorting domain-containing protein [Ignavibacterium sp.]|uniref:WD40/YVTN/BNR-like repeat-containing protein n=1 Tax=Ignavibacterium sp. TaxID=2651167 RepID=UPI0025C501D0|nr:T9SS type A sorting domain-containing protein [Ignavibacterium sp.]
MRIIYTVILLVLLVISFNNAQWQQVNTGLPGLSVYVLATDGQYTYAGLSTSSVYRSSDKGDNWMPVNNGLPIANAWELFSNNDTLFVGFFYSGAFRSTDHGNTWDTLIVGIANSAVRGFISNNKYLFASTWGNGIYRSSDGGNNWTQINNGIIYQTFWDIFAIEDTLIAASNGGVYRSTNNGDSWVASNTGLGLAVSYRIASLGNFIFLGTASSGVFRSSDYGKSWSSVGLSNQTIYALLTYDTLLFAGTANSGVFVSFDYGNNWQAFNQGNPVGSIVELIYDNTYIYAATLGGGVYRYNRNNVTSINEINSEVPSSFELSQNYPNPFNPSTNIKFSIPNVGSELAQTVLKVYDVLGNEVATLVDEYREPGSYEVEFQSVVGNRQLASGVYFYKLQTGDPSTSSGQGFVEIKKMILLR